MTDLRFKIEPGSDITVAHRAAVAKAVGAFIDSFKYDEKTGEVFVSIRPLPPFGQLEKESEASKLLEKIIADVTKSNTAIAQRESDVDKREKEANQRDVKLKRDRTQLDKERKEFEDEKKGKKKPSLISRVLKR